MHRDGVRCSGCGHVNDVAAIDCARCGGSLVAAGQQRWEADAIDRELAAGTAETRDRRRAVAARIAVAIVLVAFIALAARYGPSWVRENVYVGEEPTYDGKSAVDYAAMLASPDHYLRRRAARTLDAMADRLKKPTAHEVAPALREALEDEDPVVRKYAESALAKLEKHFDDR